MASFNIGRTDRVFFVGSTGSGKTTLAKSLLWGLPYVVILDPKHTFSLPESWPHGWHYANAPRRHQDMRDAATLVYRPTYDEILDGCEEFFQWIFARGNTIVYVDEAATISKPRSIGRGYDRNIREGREKGIGIWSATQRPRFIPQVLMTESESFFVFRLRSEEDRKIVAGFTISEVRDKVPTGNGFWYYNDKTQRAKYYAKANVGDVLK
ncbi:MAG: hypothetical protein ACR2OE_01100 [Thermomicrobiales bacterium]